MFALYWVFMIPLVGQALAAGSGIWVVVLGHSKATKGRLHGPLCLVPSAETRAGLDSRASPHTLLCANL